MPATCRQPSRAVARRILDLERKRWRGGNWKKRRVDIKKGLSQIRASPTSGGDRDFGSALGRALRRPSASWIPGTLAPPLWVGPHPSGSLRRRIRWVNARPTPNPEPMYSVDGRRRRCSRREGERGTRVGGGGVGGGRGRGNGVGTTAYTAAGREPLRPPSQEKKLKCTVGKQCSGALMESRIVTTVTPFPREIVPHPRGRSVPVRYGSEFQYGTPSVSSEHPVSEDGCFGSEK